MKSRGATTVLQMTSMPVLVTLALLLLLVVGSLMITATRAADGFSGSAVEAGDAAWVEPQRGTAIARDLGDA
jgi:hypothetical protein